MTAKFPRTEAFIISLGLDPTPIMIDGIDVNGYDEIVRDRSDPQIKTTFHVNENGDVVPNTKRKSWPTLSDGIHIIDLFIQEGGTKR